MATPRPAATFGRNNTRDSVVSAAGPFLGMQREKTSKPGGLSREYLRQQARWIRDTLDIEVARDGPDALHSDDLLTMDELLRNLLESDISRDDIRYSRIHLAVKIVSGLATRWPTKLIDRCDALNDVWLNKFGPFEEGTMLYEPGGRLHGICKPEDLDKEKLTVKWLKSPDSRLSPMVSRKSGNLGFVPGDWWISPLFAHRAGIIDSSSSEGGIVCDAQAAYAIVLTDSDEKSAPDGETIEYRARGNDPGRYRLTAASPESRHPVRILRSHRLNSTWKPRAGVRYEGLYKIANWSLKGDSRTKETDYTVTFERLPNQRSFESVLARPRVDELEDYTEYKRLRDIEHSRKKENEDRQPKSPEAVPAVDGISDNLLTMSTQHSDYQMLPHSRDGPLWHANLALSPKQQPTRRESPSTHDEDRRRRGVDLTAAMPVHWIPGMQAGWWVDPPLLQVQTVTGHRRGLSEAEIAGQMKYANAGQR